MTGTTFTTPLCISDTRDNHKLLSRQAIISASEGVSIQGDEVNAATAFSVYLPAVSTMAGKTFTIDVEI